MIVRLSDDAERDLMEGAAFYSQHGLEVGDHFLTSLLADLHAMAVLGGVHAIRYGYHCARAKRFPYAIYYRVKDHVVSVVAILDERKDPTWISRRLRRG